MSELNNEHLGWLIRDQSNRIRGPFPRQEVLQLLKKNQLKIKTEISRSNSYWFSLEEKVEIARFFPELGGPSPAPEPTQMTATLTQASVEQRVEVTQFMQSPARQDLNQASKEAEEAPKTEWLNPEDAAEFGDLDGFTISVQTDISMMSPSPAAPTQAPGPLQMEESPAGAEDPTREIPASEREAMRAQEDAARHAREEREAQEKTARKERELAERRAKEDMLNRSQVKADTLPSEYHDYEGTRPKLINNLFKAPERASPEPAPAPAIISVPVDTHGAHAANIIRPAEKKPLDPAKKKTLVYAGAGIALAALVGAYLLTLDRPSGPRAAPTRQAASIEPALKKSLLLFDLDGAKEALAEYELSANGKGRPTAPLAQAILRKDFLFDTEGALGSLQMARTLAQEPALSAEIENLIGVYRFERDPAQSAEELRKVAEANPAEGVFRYNWALSLQRSNRSAEAIQALAPLFSTLPKGSPLLEDAATLLGWARETAGKGQDLGAEGAFQRALEINPDNPKARMGIAIHRLRKGGLRESESDFRAFIESMPELDPPSDVPKFRQMSDFDFYRYARAQLGDLNTPGPIVGNKPSPMIMAADAVISSILSQTGDATKIVTDALKAAPGDTYALKAMGYVLWKDGKYNELAELFNDPTKDRGSFSVNLLLGKALLKMGRKLEAEKLIASLTVANPLRADGWSLLGDLQLSNGHAAEARKSFAQALSRDPYDLMALRGLDRLKDREVITPAIARNLPF
ncbi:MAG: tetratricopeptide repeat protein [Proteobacteria bacterium]|nr:MAG: tetratricopeptide repeat protein [Pseudomonadota bacterium]